MSNLFMTALNTRPVRKSKPAKSKVKIRPRNTSTPAKSNVKIRPRNTSTPAKSNVKIRPRNTETSKPKLTLQRRSMTPDRKYAKKVDGKTRNISANQLYAESLSQGMSHSQAYARHVSVFGENQSLTPTSYLNRTQDQEILNVVNRSRRVRPSRNDIENLSVDIEPTVVAQESEEYIPPVDTLEDENSKGEVVETVSEVEKAPSIKVSTLLIGAGSFALLGSLVYLYSKSKN